jgi:hypothetical protein
MAPDNPTRITASTYRRFEHGRVPAQHAALPRLRLVAANPRRYAVSALIWSSPYALLMARNGVLELYKI